MIVRRPFRQPRSSALRDAAARSATPSSGVRTHLVADATTRRLVVPAAARVRGAVMPIVAPPTRRAPGQRRPPPPSRH
ncbi:hypothetical protein [Micromonospora citrea]|uniref:hypothetical protein n=1 Tax=Micromonospora citrea TaxID=47855 RepID=UPI000B83E765|nr:hypothetical protein [Micromonospora citrea]